MWKDKEGSPVLRKGGNYESDEAQGKEGDPCPEAIIHGHTMEVVVLVPKAKGMEMMELSKFKLGTYGMEVKGLQESGRELTTTALGRVMSGEGRVHEITLSHNEVVFLGYMVVGGTKTFFGESAIGTNWEEDSEEAEGEPIEMLHKNGNFLGSVKGEKQGRRSLVGG
ncbi:hypothetical protein U1Q18_008712 [Sarracenia purpurea var. burkii]